MPISEAIPNFDEEAENGGVDLNVNEQSEIYEPMIELTPVQRTKRQQERDKYLRKFPNFRFLDYDGPVLGPEKPRTDCWWYCKTCGSKEFKDDWPGDLHVV